MGAAQEVRLMSLPTLGQAFPVLALCILRMRREGEGPLVFDCQICLSRSPFTQPPFCHPLGQATPSVGSRDWVWWKALFFSKKNVCEDPLSHECL